jgi:hypothetical protein
MSFECAAASIINTQKNYFVDENGGGRLRIGTRKRAAKGQAIALSSNSPPDRDCDRQSRVDRRSL